jgi:hypothetical protein
MPKVFAVRMAPHPVLDVIFSVQARLIPRLLRSFAIVRMDGLEPIKPEALVEAKPSKRDPLRARPGPGPIGRVRNTSCGILEARSLSE